jgi:hypothetical protein
MPCSKLGATGKTEREREREREYTVFLYSDKNKALK